MSCVTDVSQTLIFKKFESGGYVVPAGLTTPSSEYGWKDNAVYDENEYNLKFIYNPCTDDICTNADVDVGNDLQLLMVDAMIDSDLNV